jgi:hypothetical protein
MKLQLPLHGNEGVGTTKFQVTNYTTGLEYLRS